MKTCDHSSALILRQIYSREQISEIPGGSEVWFLPTVGGRVVCGCFNLDHNPDAPDRILPGTGPMIERTAEWFCGQDHPVPIFIKRCPKEWENVGHYQADRSSTDRADIAKHHADSVTPLHKVTRVIFLKPASVP